MPKVTLTRDEIATLLNSKLITQDESLHSKLSIAWGKKTQIGLEDMRTGSVFFTNPSRDALSGEASVKVFYSEKSGRVYVDRL